jgi:uncharacterized protein (TIRG00374 family)
MHDTRRHRRLAIGFGITAVFVWLLTRQIDPTKITASLERISSIYVAIAVGLLVLDYLARIARWWTLLRAAGSSVSYRSCCRPFLASIALNNLLPFRAGDAVRVVGFRDTLDAPAMRVLGTVVVERLLDLLSLLAIFFIGLAAAQGVPPLVVRGTQWLGAMLIVSLVLVVWLAKPLQRVLERLLLSSHLFGGAGKNSRLVEHIGHLLAALSVLKRPRLAAQLIALSIIAWACEGAVFATVGTALGVSTAGPWFALSTGTLGTLLPSSPGYVGSFDYLASLGLTAYGSDAHTAALFAMSVHLVLWLPLTLIGCLYLSAPYIRQLQGHAPITTAPPQRN